MMPYHIEVNDEAALVTVKRWGFWSISEAEMYKNESSTILSRIADESFSLLIDVTDSKTMSREVADVVEANLLHVTDRGISRIAYVGASAIDRMQLKRISGARTQLKFFDNVASAKEWASGIS